MTPILRRAFKVLESAWAGTKRTLIECMWQKAREDGGLSKRMTGDFTCL